MVAKRKEKKKRKKAMIDCLGKGSSSGPPQPGRKEDWLPESRGT